MKKKSSNQANKYHSGIFSETGSKSKVAPNYKKGGEDPPKSSPFAAIQAPSGKLSVPSAPSKEDAVKATSAKFKTNKNYNYIDTKIRANKSDSPKATAKAEKKESQSRFTKMYQSGEISRSDYKDSMMTLEAPGTSKKEVRQIVRSKVGGGVENIARDAKRSVKKAGKNIAAAVKKTGKSIKKACTPSSGGSCNPMFNKTLGGKF
jgi:hypothetical protein